MNEAEVEWACGTHGKDKKCTQDFGSESWNEGAICGT